MRRKGKQFGFEELSPNQTANALFSDHKPGDKVAIISRYEEGIELHIQALEARGLKARFVGGQRGIEDFCFLLRAQKQIIGVGTSTFASFAGILGDAKKVLLYSVDSEARRSPRSLVKLFPHYNYTNKVLKNRILFRLIKAD